jgi:hypothetical protein
VRSADRRARTIQWLRKRIEQQDAFGAMRGIEEARAVGAMLNGAREDDEEALPRVKQAIEDFVKSTHHVVDVGVVPGACHHPLRVGTTPSVALLVSGRLRTLAVVQPNWHANLMSLLEDVSIFAFVTVDPNSADELATLERFRTLPQMRALVVNYDNEAELAQIVREDQPDAPFPHRAPEVKPLVNLLQFRGMWMANELRRMYERRCQYRHDISLRMRTDIWFMHPVDLAAIARERINVPMFLDYRDGWNDRFSIGSSERMNAIFDLFFDIPRLYQSGVCMHAETMLKHHLMRLGEFPNRFDFDTFIKRSDVDVPEANRFPGSEGRENC